jgi:tetratricopeptide (TPR) repeat protein
MGDAVNLASRLEEHARVGRILVSEATYQLTRHAVQYGAGTATSIRGKHEHVNAFEVEGLASEGPVDEVNPFVGRIRESAELERLLAQTGRCRSALIQGPAGSGKTRLVEQLRLTHSGTAEFVAIRCSDFAERGPSVAGQSLVHTLQHTIAARPTLVDNTDLPTQPGEPDLDDAPQSAAWLEILATSTASLLHGLAHDRPLLVSVERLDLADAATLNLLQSTLARLEDSDILLLVSTRGSPAGTWPMDASVVELAPLDPDECLTLLRAATGGLALQPAAVERLIGLSGAWPGPLLELTRVALDSGQLHAVDEELRLAVPLDIRTAFAVRTRLQAQLDSLTLQDRNALCLCTIAGASGHTAVLADALGISSEAAEEVLERLVEDGYLERSDVSPIDKNTSYAVGDELTRLIIDASLTQVERRRLHERIALALQHTYDPGQPDPRGLLRIARHFAASGQAWNSVEYLLRSADLSATTASVEAAVDFYRAVLNEATALSDTRERARLTLEVQDRIGEALLWGGSLAEAQIAFEQAAGNSASVQRRAELQLKLGVIGLRRGNPRRVFQIGRAVLGYADTPPAVRVGGNALVSLARAAQGMLRDALEYADTTLRLAVDEADPGRLGLAHFAIGRAQFLAGDLVAARQELQQSVAARDEAGDMIAAAESRVQLGVIQRALGALDDAEQTVRNALEQPELRVAAGAPVASGQPAAAHWRHRWTLASAALVLGRLRLDRGDPTRARRHFASAFRAAEALAAREMALEARVELGSLEASSPTTTQTAESLTRVLDELRSVLDAALALELRPLACRTRIALGVVLCSEAALAASPGSASNARAREAALLARDALVQARSLGLKLQSAGARQVLATALAQLGYWPQAAREFDTAVTELEQLGAKVDLVRALIAYADVERQFGAPAHPDSVRSHLAQAAQLAGSIGLSQDRQNALGLLSALGA